MKRLETYLLFSALLATTVFPAQAQEDSSIAKVVRDVEYANIDGHRLLLDLYSPEQEEDAPLLV